MLNVKTGYNKFRGVNAKGFYLLHCSIALRTVWFSLIAIF